MRKITTGKTAYTLKPAHFTTAKTHNTGVNGKEHLY